MFKKVLSIIVCATTLGVVCTGLASCIEEEEITSQEGHDSSKWFTDEELSKVGLGGLAAPTGLTGEMYSTDTWFNNRYFFSQPCPDEDTFYLNAEAYFSYFNTYYDGKFGKPEIEKLGLQTNEAWYAIKEKESISDYYGDNPSDLYKFYYATNTTDLDNGYFVKGSVWSFEIRYEFDSSSNGYLFKILIESADTNHSGSYTNYYRIK